MFARTIGVSRENKESEIGLAWLQNNHHSSLETFFYYKVSNSLTKNGGFIPFKTIPNAFNKNFIN